MFTAVGRTRYIRRPWCICPEAIQARQVKERDDEIRRLEARAAQYLMSAKIHQGRYDRMTFETWDSGRHPQASKALVAVLDYAATVQQGQPNLLYLYGPYGTGKTHLAIAALRHIITCRIDEGKNGWRGYFADWSEHCSTVQQSWDRDSNGAGPSERQLWGMMKLADVLVLDDLDKRAPTEWAIGKLFEVVQYRYIRERATIVTANRSIEDLQAIWQADKKLFVKDTGGAILSRVMGQLWGQVHIGGYDQRQV